jgi:hypothetical protein
VFIAGLHFGHGLQHFVEQDQPTVPRYGSNQAAARACSEEADALDAYILGEVGEC